MGKIKEAIALLKAVKTWGDEDFEYINKYVFNRIPQRRFRAKEALGIGNDKAYNMLLGLIDQEIQDVTEKCLDIVIEMLEEGHSFAGFYDSFGQPIHEGDAVEYFDWDLANAGRFPDGGQGDPYNPNKEWVEKAIESGYTAKHVRIDFINGQRKENISMYKPLIGVVKWNESCMTYEPLVKDIEYWNDRCFAYLAHNSSDESTYCKVIKSAFMTIEECLQSNRFNPSANQIRNGNKKQ